jgi:hypothetical protein
MFQNRVAMEVRVKKGCLEAKCYKCWKTILFKRYTIEDGLVVIADEIDLFELK